MSYNECPEEYEGYEIPTQGASELKDLLGWPGMKGKPGEIYRLTIDFDTNGEMPPKLTIWLPQKMLEDGLACEGLTIEANGNTVIRASMWRKHANGCDIDMVTPNVQAKGIEPDGEIPA